MKKPSLVAMIAIVTTLLVVIAYTAQASQLDFTQNPDPFIAPEGTAGNIGFINVANDPNSGARFEIDQIRVSALTFFGGEFDDQATNLFVVAPKPTPLNPIVLLPGTNFNVKISWDAVDNIKDNDVDFGVWLSTLSVDDLATKVTEGVSFTLKVTDTPIPASLPLFATGIGALGLLGWRRKRKAQRLHSGEPKARSLT